MNDYASSSSLAPSLGRRVLIVSAAVISIVLVVLALWAWGRASWLSRDATRPDVARWAVRSAAVAALAGAQLLLLSVVAGRIYQRRSAASLLTRVVLGGIGCVALVSAIALGLAGR